MRRYFYTVVLTVASCSGGGKGGGPMDPPVSQNIEVTSAPSSLRLAAGQQAQLHVTVTAEGTPQVGCVLIYSSSNENSATVTTTGLVEARLPGVATIRVTADCAAGSGTAQTAVEVFSLQLVSISAGPDEHACAIASTGAAYCWGENNSGQLGDGTTSRRNRPTLVAGGISFTRSPGPPGSNGVSDAIAISAGEEHTCAVGEDLFVYCWGRNDHGQLGDGTVGGDRVLPNRVVGGHQILQIQAGTNMTCGITVSLQVYCWGETPSGMTASPQLVSMGLAFVSISLGEDHVCGLTNTGEAYCWGENSDGRLGDGTELDRISPSLVAGGHHFKSLSAGFEHTCGVTVSGFPMCWGENRDGRLGDGSLQNERTEPVQVMNAPAMAEISASETHTCGLDLNRNAYCWGSNFSGQLGDGSEEDQATPVLVSGDHRFNEISAGCCGSFFPGSGFTCGVATDGFAYCWGDNSSGQLGVGSSSMQLTPVRIDGF